MRARLRGGERCERGFGSERRERASESSSGGKRASERVVVGRESSVATLRERLFGSERVFGRERASEASSGGRAPPLATNSASRAAAPPTTTTRGLECRSRSPPRISQAEAPSVFVTTPLFLPSINRASPPPDPLSSPPRPPTTRCAQPMPRAPLCVSSPFSRFPLCPPLQLDRARVDCVAFPDDGAAKRCVFVTTRWRPRVAARSDRWRCGVGHHRPPPYISIYIIIYKYINIYIYIIYIIYIYIHMYTIIYIFIDTITMYILYN